MAVSQLRTSARVFNFVRRIAVPSSRSLKSKAEVPEGSDELDQPIKYSTSPAATWAARHSFAGANNDDVPWFQRHIVVYSLAAFLIYFLYLREANDIDAILERDLSFYFDGVPEDELKTKIAENTGIQARK